MEVRVMFAVVTMSAMLGLFQFPITAGAAEPASVTISRGPKGQVEVRNAYGPASHGKIQSITDQGAVQTIVVVDGKELTTPPSKSSAATNGTDAGKPLAADAKKPAAVKVIRRSNGFIELRNADGSPFMGDVEVVATPVDGRTQRFLIVKDADNSSPESSPAADATKETTAAGHGRYQVSGGEAPVMVDTATGQSWVLVQFGRNVPDALGDHQVVDRLWWTWIPTRRIDDFKEAKELIVLDRQFNRVKMEEDAQRSRF